ncbi:MAG TPA: hypothetical protein VGM28_08945 [Candidatus Limnocylindrales bacterium]
MSNLVDIASQPVIDVWGGGAVRARKIDARGRADATAWAVRRGVA